MASVEPTTQAGASNRSDWYLSFLRLSETLTVVVLLVLVFVFTSARMPSYVSLTNIQNMLVQASIMAVTAYGMTLAIAMRGFDLSVGSVMCLSSLVTAGLLQTTNVFLAVLGGLAVGLGFGLINGSAIARFGIPAFVATLGTMSVARGIGLAYTNGGSILITKHPDFVLLNTTKIAGVVPVPFVIALGLCVVMYMVIRHTSFGRNAMAIGGNPTAAVSAGINVRRQTTAVFGIVGLCAGISGVMLAAQLMTVDGTLGADFALKTIAVAVLGGASLAGGTANVPGTLLAAILLASINTALNVLRVSVYSQYVALGVVLIFAVSLDSLRRALVAGAVRERRL
jgi:ribose/xylose/arabinose/galactoside ABC-type transport system permease subunit